MGIIKSTWRISRANERDARVPLTFSVGALTLWSSSQHRCGPGNNLSGSHGSWESSHLRLVSVSRRLWTSFRWRPPRLNPQALVQNCLYYLRKEIICLSETSWNLAGTSNQKREKKTLKKKYMKVVRTVFIISWYFKKYFAILFNLVEPVRFLQEKEERFGDPKFTCKAPELNSFPRWNFIWLSAMFTWTCLKNNTTACRLCLLTRLKS